MNKEKYLKKGQDLGFPSRCPILEYCERHARTIYFFSDYSNIDYNNNYIQALNREGAIPSDFEEKVIKLKSEPPIWSKGKTNGMFSNMCPEVSLFDTENSLGFAKGISCTDGVWDSELKLSDRFTSLETKHYSECLEFSNYLFENKFNGVKKITKPKVIHCFTYLMINHNTGFHKIGVSHNPKYREKTLQGQEPEIETVAERKFIIRKLALELESELHEKYSDKRMRGEWFDLNPKEINEIVKLLTM